MPALEAGDGLATAGAGQPPLLDVRNLSAGYGERPVLQGVSLSVRKGELVGLIGPNGGGKSTLIRAVTRVLIPGEGDVFLGSADASTLGRRGLALRAAVVPQTPVLPELFTALEVVLMGRTAHLGLLGSEGEVDLQAARSAMVSAGCWRLARRRIGELSGGERQAVLLARALAQEAALLLLDEPTAHLDIGHQAATLSLLLALCRKGTHGVLAVVHDLTLAAQFCQRLLVLHQGKIVAEGAPSDVLSRARLSQVYRAEADVFIHPLTGRPVIVPVIGNGAAPPPL